MNIVLQLARRADGVRAPAVEGDRAEIAGFLARQLVEDDTPFARDDFVLVVLEEVDQKWRYSQAPIMTVSTFVQAFGGTDEILPATVRNDGSATLFERAESGDSAIAV